MDISSMTITELLGLYSKILKKLKSDNVIRSANLVGEIGEYVAIEYYQNTRGLPKLQAAPPGTKNIDAISINGDRYSIKATTNSTTGVFYGLNSKDSNEEDTQRFEYVIIVIFDENMSLKQILELDWNTFIKHKKWHSRMSAWNLMITRKLVEDCKVVYKQTEIS